MTKPRNYAPVDQTSGQVDIGYLGSGTPTGTKFLRDDGVLANPVASVAEIAALPTAETVTTKILNPNGAGGVQWNAAAGGPPSGAAGGELAGAYPNPTVAATHSGSAHHTQNHDHGSAGDGTTLSPAHLNVPVETPGTTHGRIGWDTTYEGLMGYDGTTARPVSVLGLGGPIGCTPGFPSLDTFATALSLAAVSAGNAGIVAIPIIVGAPGVLQGYNIRNTDTANLRTCEIRLFVADLVSNTLQFITGSDATLSFTPTVASNRNATSSGNPLLAAGVYWMVLRNTSTTQTFGIGSTASPTFVFGNNSQTITGAALTTTIDIVTGWSKLAPYRAMVVRLMYPDGTTVF